MVGGKAAKTQIPTHGGSLSSFNQLFHVQNATKELTESVLLAVSSNSPPFAWFVIGFDRCAPALSSFMHLFFGSKNVA